MTAKKDQQAPQDYIDPNSGRSPQPGGFAYKEPVREDIVDVAVADDTTQEQAGQQEQPEETEAEQVEQKETETQAKGDTLEGAARPKSRSKSS